MTKTLRFSFIYLLVTLTSPLSFAEEIIIGIGQQGSAALKQNLPERGLSREQVVQAYGEPVSSAGPTGNPPIETLHYDYFSVYLESDKVIHSVLKHVRKHQPEESGN